MRAGFPDMQRLAAEGGRRSRPGLQTAHLICNGSGVAMMTYLGHQTARKIAGSANLGCSFDTEEFPDHPLYSGIPWFLPLIGGWFRLRDSMDRAMATLS